LGHLKIIAELWGFELDAPDARTGVQRLAARLLQSEAVQEMLETLPLAPHSALQVLSQNDGRLPWPAFTRRFGVLREMGPARRDRERPFSNASASPAEALWYRGLVAHDFFDTPEGPEEFAFVPGDLLNMLPVGGRQQYPPIGRPATPAERAFPILADDSLLDDACTLLAALRIGMPKEGFEDTLLCGTQTPFPLTPIPLKLLLASMGLLDKKGVPLSEPTRQFLEAERGEALRSLAGVWMRSTVFDELRMLPGLVAEGQWQNDPLRARHGVLDFLSTVEGNLALRDDPSERPYWSLPSFISTIRQNYADFQRPAGDYDSWFIRDQESGEFLRGFEHWDAVDGALVRFIIGGPLHWLGVLDLAAPEAPTPERLAPVTAFRFSAWANDLLSLKAPQKLSAEMEGLKVASDGRLRVPRRFPRALRYQLARFCLWEGFSQDVYRYRLSPASLERARQQGLKVHHLLAIMRRATSAVPPSLIKALEGWETYGSQARLERLLVLRLKDPQVLVALRSSRAARFLGDPLGPTAVAVKPGAWEKVLSILAEMGYLADAEES